MTPAQEWAAWRKKRENGEVTKEEWLTWAEKYVGRISGGGPWLKHCEAHIRFVRNS